MNSDFEALYDAARREDLSETLEDVRDYLDRHADADYNGSSYVGNEAMKLLQRFEAVIAEVKIALCKRV